MIKLDSIMLFWIKNFVFAAILIALAYFLIANEEAIFGTESPSESVTEEKATDPSKRKVSEKQTNAAADGLSRFYANLRGKDNGDGPRVRNNIVYLDEPKSDLVELLEAKRMVTRPLRSNWRSNKVNRPFRPPFTLHQKVREYAEEEGLEVIWWLDRDFIIKDPFRIDKDIIDTAHQVGQAVEGHFQNGLSTYFCNEQRTLVFIEKELSYLDENCVKLPRKKRNSY